MSSMSSNSNPLFAEVSGGSSIPLVSVVMVAYNHEKYLRETMASVFAQSLSDLEVILVDNGSTDNSADIISGFNDPRLKVIRQENLGLSLAYNIGIESSRGKYIALGNADDTWEPEKLKLQVAAMQNNPQAAVSFAGARLIDDDGNTVDDSHASFSIEALPKARMYEKFFFKTNFMCATSALINRECINKYENVFDPCLIQLQDFDLWVRLIKKFDFVVLPEKLVGYRVRLDGQNLSLDKSNRSRVLFELNWTYRKFFENVDRELFKDAFGKHFRNKNAGCLLACKFEQAFLYLEMQEPAIRELGLELLYKLLASKNGREMAQRDYGTPIAELWNIARMPVYADSLSMEESVSRAAVTEKRLKDVEAELASLQEGLRKITSGKLWKLRERVYEILRGTR